MPDMKTQSRPYRIGTRGSDLALWQANAVRQALGSAGLGEAEIIVVTTSGDRIQDRALLEVGGKGLFTKEIEEQLLAGDIDLAVHSAKDLQTRLPDGLTIAGYLPRADVWDVFISSLAGRIEDLPPGATIGTASLRRQALARRIRPDLQMTLLRGNVPTRIEKTLNGQCGATFLALAGLQRLGLADRATSLLPLDRFPPACGQGAVAIECRSDNAPVLADIGAIDHQPTFLTVTAERAFLAVLDGSCRTPIAGHAQISGGVMRFSGLVLSADGQTEYSDHRNGDPAAAKEIGIAAGAAIREAAPRDFLETFGMEISQTAKSGPGNVGPDSTGTG